MGTDGENCLTAEANPDQKVPSILWTRGQGGEGEEKGQEWKITED